MARKSRYNVSSDKIQTSSKFIYLCGIYTRLSVEDGDDIDANSLGNQKKLCLNYLQDKIDIKYVDTYADNGFTGMTYNRPDFKRMMADLKSGRINCIIVKDISRLGRNFVMTSEYIEKKFPEMGIRFISLNDDYDSSKENADSTSLMMPLKMVMNDFYVKDISKKIRSSINAKMESNEYLPSSSSIPYGYIRNPEENTFDIDVEALIVIRQIFALKVEGKSSLYIAKYLNEKNIPSPGRLRFIRGLNTSSKYETSIWGHKTVTKILTDPVYTGCRIHGKVKRDKVGLDKTRRPESEWMIIENAHPAIIEKELFDKVQGILEAEKSKRTEFVKRPDVGLDTRELLRGKIFCADCGSIMMGGKGCARNNSKLPSRVYFNCNNYVKTQHIHCSNHYINQNTVIEKLTGLLDKQVQMAIDVENFIFDILKRPDVLAHQSGAENKFAEIRARRNNIEAKMEQLMQDLIDQIIDRSEYDIMKQRLDHNLELLLEEEAKAIEEMKSLNVAVTSTQRWIKALKQYHKIPEITREIVEVLVDKIYVTKDKNLRIILNYADPYKDLYDYLKKVEELKDAV